MSAVLLTTGGSTSSEDAEILREFVVESLEYLDQLDQDLVELELDPGSRKLLSRIFRAVHTIKGTSGFLAFHRLESLTHAGESLLSRLRDGELVLTPAIMEALLCMVDGLRGLLELVERDESDHGDATDVEATVAVLLAAADGQLLGAVESSTATPAEQPVGPSAPQAGSDGDTAPELRRSAVDTSVRVDVALLDALVRQVGELVLTRNQIVQRVDSASDAGLIRAAQRLNLVASELQEGVMRTRMQRIDQLWSKMPRLVRDLTQQLGRRVVLELEGHDTELDRSLLEALSGPLTHLVRNALDHGLEPPQERLERGKPVDGRLAVRAFHESGQVVLEITDDGRGIDTERIGAIAVERGLIDPDELRHMGAREIQEMIFKPGFSTAAQVTHVSGRGVGMDVVRTDIERIGGSVDLVSQLGLGTTCRIQVPLTLAIIPALLVGESGETYAIPQINLVELVRLEGEDRVRAVQVIGGAAVLRLRGHLLPLLVLSEVLEVRPAPSDATTIIVLQVHGIRFGLVVAEVHDTQEIVVKPLGRQLRGLATYAGATILGDGRISLILDVAGLARLHAIDTLAPAVTEPDVVPADLTELLIVQAAPGHRAALPMAHISRLEEIPVSAVERSGEREVVQYRDAILPLLRLAPGLGLPDAPAGRTHLAVAVRDDGRRQVGIVVDQVLDVVEVAVVCSDVGRRHGVLGSMVVQEHVTQLIDLDALVATDTTEDASR